MSREPEFAQTELGYWEWGAWIITFAHERYWLFAGVEYGPFFCLADAIDHARGMFIL